MLQTLGSLRYAGSLYVTGIAPYILSSLNPFCDFFLFLPTKTCYVPPINASSKWRNKLGQKLYVLIIYVVSTQDIIFQRLFIRIFHWSRQVLLACYLFIL